LAARFVDPALWNKSVQDEGEDNLDQFYLFGGMGINSQDRQKKRVYPIGNFITAIKIVDYIHISNSIPTADLKTT